MKLIVGLGNPGTDYAGTRHNVGFSVVQILADRFRIPVTRRNFRAVYGEGLIGGQRVVLARPMTYMNLSGQAVSAMCRFYKLDAAEVLVLLDDIALPLGQLRLRFKGSAGGHNGLASVLESLGTEDVERIRVGVGEAQGALVDHVLSRFRKDELPIIREACGRAADAVEIVLAEGFEIAMNRFNAR